MFNIQPGQGIGFGANREIALGLGYDYAVGGSKLRHRRIYEIEEPYNDDDDVFLIIKKIVLSGVLER